MDDQDQYVTMQRVVERLKQDSRLGVISLEYPGYIHIEFVHRFGSKAVVNFGTVNATWMGDMFHPATHEQDGVIDEHVRTFVDSDSTDDHAITAAILRSMETLGWINEKPPLENAEVCKSHMIRLAREHKANCPGAGCNISLYWIRWLLGQAKIELSEDEKLEFS